MKSIRNLSFLAGLSLFCTLNSMTDNTSSFLPIAMAHEEYQDSSEQPSSMGVKPLEDFEEDIVHVPGLKEIYGIEFDRNHPL